MSKHKKIIIGIIISCIAAIIIAGAAYYSYICYSYQKISYVDSNAEKEEEKNIDEDLEKEENSIETDELNENNPIIDKKKEIEKKINEAETKYKEVEGITNILLVGTDARDYKKKSRSDTIMILTIDDIHKKLKLTSIMRDTYAEIPGHGEQKINHSFVYGKADLLMKTIEKNFDIKLDKYAIINFMGFKDLVDAIGGLDIEVNEEQRKELNRCIIGLENYQKNFFGEEPNFLRETGMQNLDGQQVLAYSRMRHIENGCYSRDERQRTVVNMIIDKLKETSILKYPQVATTLMPCVRTNIDFSEAMDLAYTIYKIDNFNIEQLQIPVVKLSHSILYKNKGWVLLIDKKDNTKVLHDFVFEDIPLDESKYSKFNYASSPYYYKPKIKKTKPIKEENNNSSENSNDNSVQEVDNDIKVDSNVDADNQEINKNIEEDKDVDEENLNLENNTTNNKEDSTNSNKLKEDKNNSSVESKEDNAENNEDKSINLNKPKDEKNNDSIESEEDNGGIEREEDSEENKNDQNTERNNINDEDDQNTENVDNNKDDKLNNKENVDENTENKDDTLNEAEQSNNNDEINNDDETNNEKELENPKNPTNNKEEENIDNKDNDDADIIDTTNNDN